MGWVLAEVLRDLSTELSKLPEPARGLALFQSCTRSPGICHFAKVIK